MSPLTPAQQIALDQSFLLLKKPTITNVLAGVAQLDAAGDPDLWQHLAAGLSLDAAGVLTIDGEIKTRVKPGNRAQVALYAARRAGLLDGCTALTVAGNSRKHEHIPDLSPLAGLPLEQLKLTLAICPDLAPLTTLTALWRLTITWGYLPDLSGLAPLTGLRALDLGGIWFTDISPLAGLTGLERLTISSSPITDIRALAGMHRLQSLEMENLTAPSPINLRPLSGLTALERLDLSWHKATPDLAPLAPLTALRSLNLSGLQNAPPDLRPLAGLIALERLYLIGIHGLDLSPIAHLSAMKIQ